MSIKRSRLGTLNVVLVLVLGSCASELPSDFNNLSVDKKIEAYGRYLDTNIAPLQAARLSIAGHENAAAMRLAGYIAGEHSGFPELEAISILQIIQEDRCSIRDFEVSNALKKFLSRSSTTQAEYAIAKLVLDEIENKTTLPPCK
jgi:hypothetical protein